MSLRRVLSRVFGGAPESSSGDKEAPRSGRRRPPRWTPEDDAQILAIEVVPVTDRTKLAGESPLQRLARELGRTERAVISRRRRLAKAPERREAAERERARRDERDREILAMVERGASMKEAARRAGISPQAIYRMVTRKAPHLNLRAKERGTERRALRARIASEVAPRVLDAALAGEGFTLEPAEVAQLVSGLKGNSSR